MVQIKAYFTRSIRFVMATSWLEITVGKACEFLGGEALGD